MGELIERTFRVPVWHGSIEDFKRVVEVCQHIRDTAMQVVERELKSSRAESEAQFKRRQDAAVKHLVHMYAPGEEKQREQFEQRLREELSDPALRGISYGESAATQKLGELQLRVRDSSGNSSYKASPAAVLRDLNTSRTKNISIEFGYLTDFRSLAVLFSRDGGVYVTVKGVDSDWVRSSIDQLRSILLQRRPKAWWAMNSLVLYTVGLVVSSAAIYGVYNISGGADVMDLIPGVPTVLLWAYIFKQGWTALIPRFELYETGGRSKAKAIGAGALSTGAFVFGLVSDSLG